MGVAAWFVWNRYGMKVARAELFAFLIQLVLNGLWTRIFFGMQEPGWAFFEILLLLAAIVITTILFFKKNAVAGWLMVPYMLWVGLCLDFKWRYLDDELIVWNMDASWQTPCRVRQRLLCRRSLLEVGHTLTVS
nr:TspO/MBR family protein [Desulfosalsimonas propionicica]